MIRHAPMLRVIDVEIDRALSRYQLLLPTRATPRLLPFHYRLYGFSLLLMIYFAPACRPLLGVAVARYIERLLAAMFGLCVCQLRRRLHGRLLAAVFGITVVIPRYCERASNVNKPIIFGPCDEQQSHCQKMSLSPPFYTTIFLLRHFITMKKRRRDDYRDATRPVSCVIRICRRRWRVFTTPEVPSGMHMPLLGKKKRERLRSASSVCF